MEKNLKELWITALVSSEYKQGCELLHNPTTNRFCCLGVLCEVIRKKDPQLKRLTNGSYSLNKKRSINSNFDDAMLRRTGLSHDDTTALIHLNDETDKSFEDIAYYIERNL